MVEVAHPDGTDGNLAQDRRTDFEYFELSTVRSGEGYTTVALVWHTPAACGPTFLKLP
jgi:hypothetical protein